jgi:dienelactone hydrolase
MSLSKAAAFPILLGITLLASVVAPPVAHGADLTPAETRAAFRKIVDRKHSGFNGRTAHSERNGKVVETGTFMSEETEEVPFLIIRPKDKPGKLPVVIVLHGTGGNKEGVAPLLDDLATKGFFAMSIDARFHGARVPGGAKDTTAYNEAIVKAWRETDPAKMTHPFYWDTVYDVWRAVDFISRRRDVDPKRIGLVGFSKGGIETWFAAATDERIAVCVPAISVQSFKWSLENNQWQGRANTIKDAHEVAAKDIRQSRVNYEVCRQLWQKLLPGILDRFDCPRMLEAIAPRPMLILNGELDPNCPLKGAEIAFNAARKAYNELGQEEKLEIDVAKGVAHQVTEEQREKMIAWLEKWLKP